MNTKLNPCPFCSKSVASITAASELTGDDFYEHSESYAVICDASEPNGPGGCGASGGFSPTEAQAIAAWNRRAAQPVSAGLTDAQLVELIPITATILEGDPRKVCMTRAELVQFLSQFTGALLSAAQRDSQPGHINDAGEMVPDIPLGCEMARGWGVNVTIYGQPILHIGDDCLSGLADLDPWRSTIRECAEHLMAFIGTESAGQPVADTSADAPYVPKHDFTIDLQERLRKAMTTMGIATEESLEAFGNDLERSLYALCSAIERMRVGVQGASADARDAAGRESMAIGRAMNRAAIDLPAEGEIRIYLENGAGTVYWLDHKRGAWRHVDGGELFSEQINFAIDAAIAASRETPE